jgi:hypothetical protein
MWVVGLEADFQGADEKEHSTLTQNFSAPFLFANGGPAPAGVFRTTALDYAAKIEWFGTARLRGASLRQGRCRGHEHTHRGTSSGLPATPGLRSF